MMYLAYYLRNETVSDGDTELYRQAEVALDHCIERSVPSKAWMFTADEQEIIRRVLVLHDEQLMVVPAHRYLRAWDRMHTFLVADAGRSITATNA